MHMAEICMQNLIYLSHGVKLLRCEKLEGSGLEEENSHRKNYKRIILLLKF